MGLILSALAGAGGQAADFADKQIAQDQALDKERFSSDLALDRAKALEVAKVELASKERTAQVERVRGEAERMADDKLGAAAQGRAMEQQQDAAGTLVGPMPDPQQADDQMAQERKGLISRAIEDGSAAVRTGDISPKDAMGNASKLEINQIKVDNLLARAADRNQTMEAVANVRAEAMRYGYELRLQAAQEKATRGKIDTATGRMLITSEDANIKASTNQMMMLSREKENLPKMVGGKPNPRLAEIDEQLSSLQDDISTSKANKQSYMEGIGLMKPGKAAPDAPAPSLDALPMPKNKDALVAGKTYSTSRGPAVWNGTAFEAK